MFNVYYKLRFQTKIVKHFSYRIQVSTDCKRYEPFALSATFPYMVYHVDFVRVLFSLAVEVEISFELQLKKNIYFLVNCFRKIVVM